MFSQATTDLLVQHPGLVIVETDSGILLHGLVQSKSKYYHVNISCPNFPALRDFKMLVRYDFMVRKITEATIEVDKWTVNELISNLDKLSQFVGDKESGTTTPDMAKLENQEPNNNKAAVENFYVEIAALHKPDLYDIQLNACCTLIRFCKFLVNEQHYLDIELPSLQVREHSLPNSVKLPDMLSKCDSLTNMLEKFQKFIEELQPFYDNLNAIDDLCHVLQPAKPTTKHNYRLFVLRERVFLKLVIGDPFAPLSSMSLYIIGATAEVEQLRRVYSEGLKNWDAELDIQNNLLRIFDLCYFPMPPDSNTDEQHQAFCNICYSYRLQPAQGEDDELCDVPVVSCDNPQCTLIFHDSCLLKWFRTLADDVSFLNVRFGDCPFCKAKLSTSYEKLRING